MDVAKKRDVLVLAGDHSHNLKVQCPLCKRIYHEPYIASCGHTFCQECVSSESNVFCPTDGIKLSLLVKNLAVADEVGGLMVHCFYGCKEKEGSPGEYIVDSQGCQAVIKMSEKLEHEKVCDYAPVHCPNSSLCASMLRKDLAEHLNTCKYTRCPHHKYSCTFQGNQDELQQHLKSCKFEGVKGVLAKMEEQLSTLQEELALKDTKIERLTTELSELSSKMVKTEKTTEANSQRIKSIEDQHVDVRKEILQARSSITLVVSELKYVQQQLTRDLGVQQHLFACQGTFVGHKGPIWDLAKYGELLFSASSDNTIKVWNVSSTYAGPQTLTGHDGIVLALCCSGDVLFSGSSDNTIKVWSIKMLQLQSSIAAHSDPVCTLACNEKYLFSGSLRSIKVWSIPEYSLVKEMPSQNHWVRALVAHGKHLYSGSYEAVKIWSIDTLEVAHVLKCEGGSVYSLAVTNSHIICGTYENLIHVWDVNSHQELHTLRGHVGSVYSLAILKGADKIRLFSASYDKTIRVWNLELMNCAQTLARHEGSVTCLIASRGRIYSGAVDSTLKVWQ